MLWSLRSRNASVRLQIEAATQQIDLDTKAVQILQRQHDSGYASGVDLAAQKVFVGDHGRHPAGADQAVGPA